MMAFLLVNKSSSKADIPDLSDPAIGCDKTRLFGESKFKWFFTLEVSVIDISVFQRFFNDEITDWVALGDTATIIKSI